MKNIALAIIAVGFMDIAVNIPHDLFGFTLAAYSLAAAIATFIV